MKPNDRFSFLKNNRVSQDTSSLVQCYLPIIGQEALSLYLYAITFWDGGQKEHLFSHILNHLNFGMPTLLQSFKVLSALDLLTLYQRGETYELQLHSPLSSQEFLSHSVYSRLLEKKIGDTAVSAMKQAPSEGEALSVSLSQVFPTLTEEVTPSESKSKLKNDFDLEHFQQLMARDGLRFEDEQADVLELFAIADEKKWTWFETYQLAKSTAVSQVISTKRMREKIAQKSVSSDFSPKEVTIIKEAKSKTALQFLAEIKQTRKGSITQTERDLLQQMAGLGLLDEVINIILLLTFNKVDSANINEKYAMKVANDYAYQKIHSAEEAVLRIRERGQKSQAQKGSKPGPAKSNVPKWSNPDYKNETSEETRLELERKKQELLARLEKGGD
ncbi:replication initiation and membrane attachment family protein [Streptococcus oralis]|uniref:replication initiation and membrane attachment family protein n=1 Tax=Streptococcus oralis TaxID=1303 RepID=UPI000A10E539|nr:replication initiation and membrane attachment family protein [Streptococcus oralis]MCY7074162.1 replication initiation and membrane attachment family protein [Streptococcus oralis]ORO73257.1 DNA helicase [Streptococcus oralis subsp. oralis]